MTWWNFIVTFFASGLAASFAIPIIGNSLPGKYGAYIPMRAERDVFRDEFVIQHAMREVRRPCVAFFGDSRTAFNIAASTIESRLPAGCRTQNYGFASLALPQVRRLIEESEATETVVVTISETMFEWVYDQQMAEFLSNKAIRYLYLGTQRFNNLQDHLLGKPADSNPSAFVWSSSEKRWHYVPIKQRVLVKLPTAEKEVADLALNYFSVRDPDKISELRNFLQRASARARRLVVVLPPSAGPFQAAAKNLNNKQQRFRHTIAREADAVGAAVVDCSASCVSDEGFGDSVHLNDAGVAEYSREVARRIDEILPKPRS